jgi:hypothetical protein
MSTQPKIKLIKPIESFTGLSDGDFAARATAIQTAMTGNANFANPPVDLTLFKTAIDLFNTLIAEALDGSKKIKAQKNKQRQLIVHDLKLLGRYVEVTSNGDPSVFQTSGFQAASTTRTSTEPLSETIRKIEHGANSGQIKVSIRAVRGATSYELRYAQAVTGTATPTWTSQTVTAVRTPFLLTGLTPVTMYQFQARALLKTGYTDWSDSVSFVCT